MARKVCNNKVEFSACGKSVTFRLSDKELRMLRRSSIFYNGDKWETFTHGTMYNFAAYAFFEYETSRAKYGRFISNFPYKDFDKIIWFLI